MGYYDRDPSKIKWPGLDGDKSETYMNRTKVKNVIKALEDDLARYSKTVNGTPDDIGQRGLPSITAVGGAEGNAGYPGGAAVYKSMQLSKTNIQTAYTQFLTAYQTVIDALSASVENSSKADQGSEVTQNGQQSNGDQNYYGT